MTERRAGIKSGPRYWRFGILDKLRHMPHVIEPAASGRAKCRGCGQPIAKDELRFGERLPNPFGDGEMTLWFHLACGGYKRPEPLLEALTTSDHREAIGAEEEEALRAEVQTGIDHRRLPRIDGVSRAPTGRARCRNCREPIDKDSWRIGLVYYEEGYFNPSGFIHIRCWRPYFEAEELDAAAVIVRLAHFSPDLEDRDLAEIETDLDAAPAAPAGN